MQVTRESGLIKIYISTSLCVTINHGVQKWTPHGSIVPENNHLMMWILSTQYLSNPLFITVVGLLTLEEVLHWSNPYSLERTTYTSFSGQPKEQKELQ